MTIESNGSILRAELQFFLDALRQQNQSIGREVFRLYVHDKGGNRLEIVTIRL